jgi:hypothetical protein
MEARESNRGVEHLAMLSQDVYLPKNPSRSCSCVAGVVIIVMSA